MLRFVRNVIDWQSLGLELGILYSKLKKIEKDCHRDISACTREMLYTWLQNLYNVRKTGAPSWTTLRTALRNIGEMELADAIPTDGELITACLSLYLHNYTKVHVFFLHVHNVH